MAPYLSHLSQFCLHVVNLVSLKSQSRKHKQEQQQHDNDQAGVDSHEAPTLPRAPHPLLGRWEGPAGYKVRRLSRMLRISTSIHKVNLRQRIALVIAGHGATVRQTAFICCVCMKEVHLCLKRPTQLSCWVHPQNPPTCSIRQSLKITSPQSKNLSTYQSINLLLSYRLQWLHGTYLKKQIRCCDVHVSLTLR